MIEYLLSHQYLVTLLVFILGLCIGSFLNVVIYRLPLMLTREWLYQSQEFLQEHQVVIGNLPKALPVNLAWPASACPNCHTAIKWYQNIPLISFFFLGGKCASCTKAISWRYPAVEILTALAFLVCFYKFSLTPALICALIFVSILIALAVIDLTSLLLPDQLTLLLLWLGLLASAFKLIPTTLFEAVIASAIGYMFFWLVATISALILKKTAMGNGDFKLLAALGAWLGWSALMPIVFLASLVGCLVAIPTKLVNQSTPRQIPFGPYLVGAGLGVFFCGTQWFYACVTYYVG